MKNWKKYFIDVILWVLYGLTICLKTVPLYFGLVFGLYLIGAQGTTATILFFLFVVFYCLLLFFEWIIWEFISFRSDKENKQNSSEEVTKSSDVEEKRI